MEVSYMSYIKNQENHFVKKLFFKMSTQQWYSIEQQVYTGETTWRKGESAKYKCPTGSLAYFGSMKELIRTYSKSGMNPTNAYYMIMLLLSYMRDSKWRRTWTECVSSQERLEFLDFFQRVDEEDKSLPKYELQREMWNKIADDFRFLKEDENQDFTNPTIVADWDKLREGYEWLTTDLTDKLKRIPITGYATITGGDRLEGVFSTRQEAIQRARQNAERTTVKRRIVKVVAEMQGFRKNGFYVCEGVVADHVLLVNDQNNRVYVPLDAIQNGRGLSMTD